MKNLLIYSEIPAPNEAPKITYYTFETESRELLDLLHTCNCKTANRDPWIPEMLLLNDAISTDKRYCTKSNFSLNCCIGLGEGVQAAHHYEYYDADNTFMFSFLLQKNPTK